MSLDPLFLNCHTISQVLNFPKHFLLYSFSRNNIVEILVCVVPCSSSASTSMLPYCCSSVFFLWTEQALEIRTMFVQDIVLEDQLFAVCILHFNSLVCYTFSEWHKVCIKFQSGLSLLYSSFIGAFLFFTRNYLQRVILGFFSIL